MFSVSNLNGSPSITSVPPSAASVIFFSPRSPALNEPPTSPGHRKNILNPDFEYIGVGLARGGSYGIYWAQELATFK